MIATLPFSPLCEVGDLCIWKLFYRKASEAFEAIEEREDVEAIKDTILLFLLHPLHLSVLRPCLLHHLRYLRPKPCNRKLFGVIP